VAFSPDGSLVAANDWSGHIEIWEADRPTAKGRADAGRVDRDRAFGWHLERAASHPGNPAAVDFHLERIRAETPPGSPPAIAQAELERRRGRLPIADAILTRWLERHPDDVEALLRRADLSTRQGRWRRALDDLAAAVAARPDDERAWLLGAVALVRLGDTDGHRRHCRELIRRFGEIPGRLPYDAALACLLSPEAPADDPAIGALLARFAGPPGGPHHAPWDAAISLLAGLRGAPPGSDARRHRAAIEAPPEETHLRALLALLEALAASRAAPPDLEASRHSLGRASEILEQSGAAAGGDSASCWARLSCDSLRLEIEGRIADAIFPADPLAPVLQLE
jgi:tetratricopeptide (TPR) repeat protein